MRKPSRKPRCGICHEYKADRRFRDRQGSLHMICGGCVSKWMENQRMYIPAAPAAPEMK
jgi:hypothetical protein